MRALAIAWLLALPAIAVAQPGEPERLFLEGQKAYDAQRYDGALVAWLRSYELSKLPALLFNIGQAYRLRGFAGDCARAMDAYRRFVELDPRSPQRAAADGFIAELRACAATPPPPPGAGRTGPPPGGAAGARGPVAAPGAQRPSSPGAQPGGAGSPSAGAAGAQPGGAGSPSAGAAGVQPGGAGSPSAGAAGGQPGGATSPSTGVAGEAGPSAGGLSAATSGASVGADRPARGDGSTKRLAAYVVGGASVAIGLTGVYFGTKARSIGKEVTETCKDGCDWSVVAKRDAEGRSAERTQWVFYGIGAVGLATAGVLYVLGARERSAAVAIAPRLDGGGMVTWSGAW